MKKFLNTPGFAAIAIVEFLLDEGHPTRTDFAADERESREAFEDFVEDEDDWACEIEFKNDPKDVD